MTLIKKWKELKEEYSINKEDIYSFYKDKDSIRHCFVDSFDKDENRISMNFYFYPELRQIQIVQFVIYKDSTKDSEYTSIYTESY